MSSTPAGDGAKVPPALVPPWGYTLNLLWFIFLFMLISENNMNTSTYHVFTKSLIYVMKILLIFGIKIYRNMPICLTIQKHDSVNRLSVANFSSSI
jgi:hypothetical protein